MTARPPFMCDPQDPHCSVCGDDAQEAEVTAVLPASLARVRTSRGDVEIATDLVGAVAVGDRLMVHMGFAIARLA